jgi:hypothetical protein
MRLASGAKTPASNYFESRALQLKLIFPAFRLAADTREFTTRFFQHDGLSLHFLRRGEVWVRRIADVIQEEIAQHGVEAKLEW